MNMAVKQFQIQGGNFDSLLENIKSAKSLPEFKNKLKLLTPINCSGKLCKIYVANISLYKYFESCGSDSLIFTEYFCVRN